MDDKLSILATIGWIDGRPTSAILRGLIRPVQLLFGLFLLSGILLSAPSWAGDVTYDYDGQGRLVAAVNNTINTGTNGVQYVYDAVGNITAINALGATGGTRPPNAVATPGFARFVPSRAD